MGIHNSTGYSADVRIWLRCDDQMLIPLSHASSTFVIAKNAIDYPACNAHIVFTIDEERFERPVRLVDGMKKESREAMVLSRDEISPF